MSELAIRAESIGKQYRIGQYVGYKTMSESLTRAFTAPFRAFKRNGNHRNSDGDYIWALRDISFEVERGEVVGIIGRNGAGKSTLLKVLIRITAPTEGLAVIYGRVGSLLEVGTGFHQELTGRENIYLNGAILGMRKKEINRKYDDIVEFSGVEMFIDTPLKRYSSGMQMRLAFSVAAHLEPEILLVDEVLAVGDAEFQKKCLGRMGDFAKEGRTVLFVSHNMLSLQNLCTRGILLEEGRVVLDDAITTVIKKYLDLGAEYRGEVCWDTPDEAPGNERARLKAARIVSEGKTTRVVDISKDFHIEIDYWNLEANSRRLISIQLHNSFGVCVLSSANYPSVSKTPDTWYSQPYPQGLFRTVCTIPGDLLNDGSYSISVNIQASISDGIIARKDILSFTVQDTGGMRREFTGRWDGVVRPRIDWETSQMEVGVLK